MVTFLQRTFTSLVHAHAGRTQGRKHGSQKATLRFAFCLRLRLALGLIRGVLPMGNPVFTFEVDNHAVVFVSSPYGSEKLYINGSLVISKFSIRLNSKHRFHINNQEYNIKFKVLNVFTGELLCELYSKSNGLISSKYTKAKLTDKNKNTSIILLIILSAFVGYVAPRLGAWLWLTPLLFILAVIISMSIRERVYEIESKT